MISAPSRRRLGMALRNLRPVGHALRDPHFTLVPRPVDSGWHYLGVTGSMGGFNPIQHAHYFPVVSVLANWLEDPANASTTPQEDECLAKEVFVMAHDYLHSWAYRAISHLEPSLAAHNLVTPADGDLQAFIFVLTEAVAVVGIDYWYLSVRGAGERCRLAMDIGPRTVHYQERYLDEYRRAKPDLVVQRPEFFLDVVKLYCDGIIEGFEENDLLECRPLADWLIRELLIAPRQREVSRLWMSRLGGYELDETQLDRSFAALSTTYQDLVRQLGVLLWRKVKHGAYLFFPESAEMSPWRYRPNSLIDFRFANLNRVAGRKVRWPGGFHGTESWRFFVDQVISAYRLPALRSEQEAVRREVDVIKAEIDAQRLERLTDGLTAVTQIDNAPLELLFVN